jgi:hypothetical protein
MVSPVVWCIDRSLSALADARWRQAESKRGESKQAMHGSIGTLETI